MADQATASPRACRECGCTEARACPGGCWWVLPDVCSACAAYLLIDAGLDATPVALGGAVMQAYQDGGPAAVIGLLDEVFSVPLGADGVAVPEEHPGFEPEPAGPRLWRPGEPL